MKIISSPAAMQRLGRAWRVEEKNVGLVPTMGALHAGHLSLFVLARKKCQRTVVSIYVNPAQFGPREDLATYPRPRRQDLQLCREAGVDVVFAPRDLYAPDHSTWIEEQVCAQGQEGAVRPGHFRGVATVVLKLLNLVQPTHAFFGQKDAQQVAVVRRLLRDLDVPVKLVVGPTIRDADGLALSSRNRYLSASERRHAAHFAQLLQQAARRGDGAIAWFKAQLKKHPEILLDYIEAVPEARNQRLVAAVKIGTTRLLDNRLLQNH